MLADSFGLLHSQFGLGSLSLGYTECHVVQFSSLVFSPHHDGEVASAALGFQRLSAALDVSSVWGTGGFYRASTVPVCWHT